MKGSKRFLIAAIVVSLLTAHCPVYAITPEPVKTDQDHLPVYSPKLADWQVPADMHVVGEQSQLLADQALAGADAGAVAPNCADYSLAELLPDYDLAEISAGLAKDGNGNTSLFDMKEFANSHGLDMEAVKAEFKNLVADDDAQAVVHFRYGHYVKLVSFDEEPGIGTYKDNGEIKTATQEEFEKNFSGYALVSRTKAGSYQVISDSEAQGVRGAANGYASKGGSYSSGGWGGNSYSSGSGGSAGKGSSSSSSSGSYGPSGASGLLSAGALRAASYAGGVQSSSSLSGSSPSWTFSSGNSSMTLSGNQVQSVYSYGLGQGWYANGQSSVNPIGGFNQLSLMNKMGVMSAIMTGGLSSGISPGGIFSQIANMSKVSATISQFTFSLSGPKPSTEPVKSDLGQIPAGFDWKDAGRVSPIGDPMCTDKGGNLIAQDRSGNWNYVDSKGKVGAQVTTIPGTGLALTGDLASNKASYGSGASYETVGYNSVDGTVYTFNVNPAGEGQMIMTLSGFGKTEANGDVSIYQTTMFGERTGEVTFISGQNNTDIASYISQALPSCIGQTTIVMSKVNDDGSLSFAKIYNYGDGSYRITADNNAEIRGSDGFGQYLTTRGIARFMEENGYQKNTYVAGLLKTINAAPGEGLNCTGTKDGVQLFTEVRETGNLVGLYKGEWYRVDEAGHIQSPAVVLEQQGNIAVDQVEVQESSDSTASEKNQLVLGLGEAVSRPKWGTEETLITQELDLLDNSQSGAYYYDLIKTQGIEVVYRDCDNKDYVALWDGKDTISVNQALAGEISQDFIAASIMHEATHADYDLNPQKYINAETGLPVKADSVEGEFQAFKNQMAAWHELRSGLVPQIIDGLGLWKVLNPGDENMYFIQDKFSHGDEAVKESIRTTYAKHGVILTEY